MYADMVRCVLCVVVVCCSLCGVALAVVRCSSFVAVVCCVLCVVCRAAFGARLLLCVVCGLMLVVCCVLYVVCGVGCAVSVSRLLFIVFVVRCLLFIV